MVASLDPDQQPGSVRRKWGGGGGLHLVQATGATIPSESPCGRPMVFRQVVQEVLGVQAAWPQVFAGPPRAMARAL